MANLKVRDSDSTVKYLKSGGTGTDGDPFVPVQDVNIQDQTSPVIIVPFHTNVANTTLGVAASPGDYTITVASPTSFAVGQYLTMYSIPSNSWFQAHILGIAGSVITLDTSVDQPYAIGDAVSVGSTDMRVDGSSTPVHFHIRHPDPGIGMTGDITRLLIVMETTAEPGWNEFGDIAALTRGVVLRKALSDGSYHNIFNAKKNSDFAALMYDWQNIDQAKFSVYGAKGRLTFGGQNKIGVVIRIEIDEDLEFIVQDDITSLGTILRFTAIAEGHVTVL